MRRRDTAAGTIDDAHPAPRRLSAHLRSMKRQQPSSAKNPSRGKSTPASTAGSFAAHAHGVPSLDLDGPATGPTIKPVTDLGRGDRLADGSLVIAAQPSPDRTRVTALIFDGQATREVSMLTADEATVAVLDAHPVNLAAVPEAEAEVDRLTEKALPAALPFHPWTGQPRTDLSEALVTKTRAYVRNQVTTRLGKALDQGAALAG